MTSRQSLQLKKHTVLCQREEQDENQGKFFQLKTTVNGKALGNIEGNRAAIPKTYMLLSPGRLPLQPATVSHSLIRYSKY